MESLDHVMVVVSNLHDAARQYESQHGLMSFPGGRHDGVGTANAIVPLGENYIELISVVDPDEAAGNPVGRYLLNRLDAEGEGLAAVCLRTTDPQGVAVRTESSPVALSRTRPSGEELRWDVLGVEGAILHGLPFFITWTLDADHPARIPVEHPCRARGIGWVELGGDPDRVRDWIGSELAEVRVVGGRAGPRRFAVATPSSEITLP